MEQFLNEVKNLIPDVYAVFLRIEQIENLGYKSGATVEEVQAAFKKEVEIYLEEIKKKP